MYAHSSSVFTVPSHTNNSLCGSPGEKTASHRLCQRRRGGDGCTSKMEWKMETVIWIIQKANTPFRRRRLLRGFVGQEVENQNLADGGPRSLGAGQRERQSGLCVPDSLEWLSGAPPASPCSGPSLGRRAEGGAPAGCRPPGPRADCLSPPLTTALRVHFI